MIKSLFKSNTLIRRLIIGFLVTSIFPLTGFALFNLHNFKQILTHTILGNMEFVAARKAFKINHAIEDSRSQLNALSHTPDVLVLFDKLKKDYYAKGGIHSAAYLQSDLKARTVLNHIIEGYTYYDLMLVDASGEIIFSLKKEADFTTNLQTGRFKDTELADGFRESMDFLTTEFSAFSNYAPSTPELTAFTTAPLLQNGLSVGVLVAEIDLEDYLPIILGKTGMGETGEALLAFLSKIGKPVFVTPLLYHPSNRHDIVLANPMKHALNGEKGKGFSMDYAGNNVVAVWQYLPDLHWGMVTKINTDEAFAPFVELRFYTFLTLGFLIVLIIVTAWILGKSIVYPVRTLIDATAKISKGDLNQHISVNNRNNELSEFSELAQTFNDMAGQIKQSYAHLERRVQARTFELNELNDKMGAMVKLQNAILDNSSLPIITTMPEGIITVFNKAAETMLGYTADEMIGKQTPIVFHDVNEIIARNKEFNEALNIPVELGFETFVIKSRLGLKNEHEWTYIAKDGQRTDVLLSISALQDETGVDITGYIGIAVNITERKNTEAQFIEAKQSAENANRAKSEFLANMSHEIRTPMNAILGLTQLVLETELNHRQHDFLSKVYSSSKALLNILNDILDYSKIETGHLEFESVCCHVETILMNVSDLFSAKLAEKSLEIYFEINPATPYSILADPLRISQILNNLVSNAIKFTSHGEIQIKVKPLHTVGSIQTLQFSVIDTGIGLSPQQIALLFQPFMQADNSISRKYGGTGLGLAICYRLVNLMNGEINVSSVEGEGSIFRFTIDVGLPKEVENSLVELQRFKGQRVLVVDDQLTSVTILKSLLEAWGIEVETALSGQEALEKIHQAEGTQGCFNAILLDWHMPGIDGLEVARQLRSQEYCGHSVVIIMVTADDKHALFIQSAGLNITNVLTKPIIPSAVFNALLDNPHNPIHLHQSRRSPDGERVLLNMRILLVEDHKINQQVATEFLTSRGAIITIANHGGEAVEHFKNAEFDAILMDLHMPEMDGLEATRQIRALPKGDAVPIIAMTAAVMDEDKKNCLQAGMVDFIAKPVQINQLIQVLCHWVKHESIDVETSPILSQSDNSALNIEAALKRLNGNSALLSRLLDDFSNEHTQTIEQLNSLLNNQEFEIAKKLLHAIQGVSANLGASLLSQRAAQLERQIKNETELTILPLFTQAMQQTLATIKAFNAKSVMPLDSDNVLSNQVLLPLLEALRPYLENNDFLPESLLEPIREVKSQDPIKTLLNRLWNQLDAFDYLGALTTLEQLIALISDSSS